LRHLLKIHERTKSQTSDESDSAPELDTVEHARLVDRLAIQAIHSEQPEKVRWRQVQVDVLEAQQYREEGAARKKSGRLASEHDREDEYAVQEAVVLEVDVVDDQQAWR